ncbi:MAG TPA: hypothetical protein EYH30_10575 [Anaerolineales bacterium]|nr:hypothetical protein [Anaerolineae bacterium]HIQ02545.1 hypothetical protein [Anaerolineales bacterium]
MVADGRKPKWLLFAGRVTLSTLSIAIAGLISWGIISQIERIVGGTIEVGGRTRITEDYLARGDDSRWVGVGAFPAASRRSDSEGGWRSYDDR